MARSSVSSTILHLGLFLSASLGVACSDKVPVPDVFEGAFLQGEVCAPATHGSGGKFSIQFKTCLYNCVAIAPGTEYFRYVYNCPPEGAGDCQIGLLASATLNRVGEDCDARLLENTPSDQCTPVTLSFQADPPGCGADGCVSRKFNAVVPYLNYEDGKDLLGLFQTDPAAANAKLGAILAQPPSPKRVFTMDFTSGGADAAATCTSIDLP